jgi:hypothetical protein
MGCAEELRERSGVVRTQVQHCRTPIGVLAVADGELTATGAMGQNGQALTLTGGEFVPHADARQLRLGNLWHLHAPIVPPPQPWLTPGRRAHSARRHTAISAVEWRAR